MGKNRKTKKKISEFQGRRDSFFIGKVKELVDPLGDSFTGEPGWTGERKMEVTKAIEIIEAEKLFSTDIKKYREVQLRILKSLLRN